MTKQEVIVMLRQLAAGDDTLALEIDRYYKAYGICNLLSYANLQVRGYFHGVVRRWPHYSGDRDFPILGESIDGTPISPNRAYSIARDVHRNQWDPNQSGQVLNIEKYVRLRLNLCAWFADQLTKP